MEDASYMLPDLEPFLPRVRALLPDTRGHGRSQKFERPEDLTYARKAEDLLLWLDDLGIARAIWGGASMGAALSLWVAVHAPDRARAVVSISGPPYAPLPSDQAWWQAHRPLVAAGRFDEYYDANVRLRMGEAALRRLRARPERYAEVTGTWSRAARTFPTARTGRKSRPSSEPSLPPSGSANKRYSQVRAGEIG